MSYKLYLFHKVKKKIYIYIYYWLLVNSFTDHDKDIGLKSAFAYLGFRTILPTLQENITSRITRKQSNPGAFGST